MNIIITQYHYLLRSIEDHKNTYQQATSTTDFDFMTCQEIEMIKLQARPITLKPDHRIVAICALIDIMVARTLHSIPLLLPFYLSRKIQPRVAVNMTFDGILRSKFVIFRQGCSFQTTCTKCYC